MARPHVGLPTLEGDIERYAAKYDLLELRPGDGAIPKPATLRAWRRKVPPSFVFSVVSRRRWANSSLRPRSMQALEQALGVARDVEARCLRHRDAALDHPDRAQQEAPRRTGRRDSARRRDARLGAARNLGDRRTIEWPTSSAWCSSSMRRASPPPKGRPHTFVCAGWASPRDFRRPRSTRLPKSSRSRREAYVIVETSGRARGRRVAAQKGARKRAPALEAEAAPCSSRGRRSTQKTKSSEGGLRPSRGGAEEAAQHILAEAGTAADALIAGFFAAAGARPGVLFSPVQTLIAGPGVGARAFDGRARQPGRVFAGRAASCAVKRSPRRLRARSLLRSARSRCCTRITASSRSRASQTTARTIARSIGIE